MYEKRLSVEELGKNDQGNEKWNWVINKFTNEVNGIMPIVKELIKF